MKKLTTKLLISVLSVALALVALGTQTFAWFAMNQQVTASGLQVEVKSDSVFLIIGNSDSAATLQSTNAITYNFDMQQTKVYPAAHLTVANATDALATGVTQEYEHNTTKERITTEAYGQLSEQDKANYTAVTGTNWYYQSADAVTASSSTKSKTYLATLDADYVIHQTCYVTLAAGSEDATNLKVKASTFTAKSGAVGTTIAPVKVLVASSSNVAELDSSNTSSAEVLASSVTDQATVKLDIFIYYNGADTSVFTNNVANLDGADITLTFSVNE